MIWGKVGLHIPSPDAIMLSKNANAINQAENISLTNLIVIITNRAFSDRNKEIEYPQWEFQKQSVNNKQHWVALMLSCVFLIC